MIDTDEYLTHSPHLRNPKADGFNDKLELPPIEEPGSLATLLQQLVLPSPDYKSLNTPCVPVYRRQFAPQESSGDNFGVVFPPGFQSESFQTLRWRKFGYKRLKYTTKFGDRCRSVREIPNKVVVDLRRLRMQDLSHPMNSGNPHRPLESICTSDVYLSSEQTPLMANHYMGTLEQWMYRVGDKRGKKTLSFVEIRTSYTSTGTLS